MAKSNRRKQPVIEEAHCPTCNREQNCILHGRADKPWRWEDRYGNSMVGGNAYSLFECCGCETVFTENSSWDENNIDQWYDHYGRSKASRSTRRLLCLVLPHAPDLIGWIKSVNSIPPCFISWMRPIDATTRNVLSLRR